MYPPFPQLYCTQLSYEIEVVQGAGGSAIAREKTVAPISGPAATNIKIHRYAETNMKFVYEKSDETNAKIVASIDKITIPDACMCGAMLEISTHPIKIENIVRSHTFTSR